MAVVAGEQRRSKKAAKREKINDSEDNSVKTLNYDREYKHEMVPLDLVDTLYLKKGNVRGKETDTKSQAFKYLKKSISEKGLLHSISVVREKDGKFGLESGFTRFEAYKQLHNEAKTPEDKKRYAEIPAHVHEHGKDEAYTWNLEENINRTDIEPIKLGERILYLREQGIPFKTIAEVLNLHVSTSYAIGAAMETIMPELIEILKKIGIAQDTLAKLGRMSKQQQEQVMAELVDNESDEVESDEDIDTPNGEEEKVPNKPKKPEKVTKPKDKKTSKDVRDTVDKVEAAAKGKDVAPAYKRRNNSDIQDHIKELKSQIKNASGKLLAELETRLDETLWHIHEDTGSKNILIKKQKENEANGYIDEAQGIEDEYVEVVKNRSKTSKVVKLGNQRNEFSRVFKKHEKNYNAAKDNDNKDKMKEIKPKMVEAKAAFEESEAEYNQAITEATKHFLSTNQGIALKERFKGAEKLRAKAEKILASAAELA